jgi:hypothetical protein
VLTIPALSPAVRIVAGGLVGGVSGAAYFAALFANARWYARHAIGPAIALQTVRFALLGLVLYGLVQVGADALLSGLAGLVAVRHTLVRRWGREP